MDWASVLVLVVDQTRLRTQRELRQHRRRTGLTDFGLLRRDSGWQEVRIRSRLLDLRRRRKYRLLRPVANSERRCRFDSDVCFRIPRGIV